MTPYQFKYKLYFTKRLFISITFTYIERISLSLLNKKNINTIVHVACYKVSYDFARFFTVQI